MNRLQHASSSGPEPTGPPEPPEGADLFPFPFKMSDDFCLQLYADRNGTTTGAHPWVCDAELVQFFNGLVAEKADQFTGKRVLELGSGLGHGGLGVLAYNPAIVCMTDRKEALPLLYYNAASNFSPSTWEAHCLSVKELMWGEELPLDCAGPWDVVLGTDVVYSEQLFPAFVSTLAKLCSEATEVVLLIPAGRPVDAFIKLLRENDFTFHKSRCPPPRGVGYHPRNMWIYRVQKNTSTEAVL